ncbi:chaperonin 11 [Monoraphidium neglectum]|uniref:Chaperonin 11 n=1 Tax=Monoraphidium neglectum TaxID=145388 RepID=A0A0D2M868_9CHLO|nr:chaperonin 11 [Monoraphidium neglectum]KIY99529.1 chaperonin 11 [Monoraphidium neglectum]|eukprot:XP_013898549.1 chaperonin 11 [Monoraphidium neglectum]
MLVCCRRAQMQPLHDRLLIKPYVEEAKTAGGILLPSAPPKANSDAHFGEVIAVGESVQLQVQPGDMIVYNKYAMAEVEVPEGEVVFVAEKSVLGKLE